MVKQCLPMCGGTTTGRLRFTILKTICAGWGNDPMCDYKTQPPKAQPPKGRPPKGVPIGTRLKERRYGG